MTWEPGDLVSLETERFTIRSMSREDATEEVLGWLADPDVAVGLNAPQRRMTRPQGVAWALAHDNARRFCLIVNERADGHPIGLFTVTCDTIHKTAETAVVIGDQGKWGQNVVVETRSAILDFLFDTLGMHKVTGRPHSRNIASIFNYKALGFTCEAVLREQMRSIQGATRLDQLVFGMLATEWRDRRSSR